MDGRSALARSDLRPECQADKVRLVDFRLIGEGLLGLRALVHLSLRLDAGDVGFGVKVRCVA